MLQEQNSLELLSKVELENLYHKLITQLNKDFKLANLSNTFLESLNPSDLIKFVAIALKQLITNNYDGYLNLIYRIDISEKELLIVKSDNLETTIEQLTFLILKREYQKVWFKKNYK